MNVLMLVGLSRPPHIITKQITHFNITSNKHIKVEKAYHPIQSISIHHKDYTYTQEWNKRHPGRSSPLNTTKTIL
jgi:hypothetical protein